MFDELHIGMVECKCPKNIGKLASIEFAHICIYIYTRQALSGAYGFHNLTLEPVLESKYIIIL